MHLQLFIQQGMALGAGMGIHHCQGGGGSPEVPGHSESPGRSGHPTPANPVCHPPAGYCCCGRRRWSPPAQVSSNTTTSHLINTSNYKVPDCTTPLHHTELRHTDYTTPDFITSAYLEKQIIYLALLVHRLKQAL